MQAMVFCSLVWPMFFFLVNYMGFYASGAVLRLTIHPVSKGMRHSLNLRQNGTAVRCVLVSVI